MTSASCSFGSGVVTKRVVKNFQCSELWDLGIMDKTMGEDLFNPHSSPV